MKRAPVISSVQPPVMTLNPSARSEIGLHSFNCWTPRAWPTGYRHHCAGKSGPAPNRFVVTFSIGLDTGVGGLAAQQASPP
jgi:hypothetical protein